MNKLQEAHSILQEFELDSIMIDTKRQEVEIEKHYGKQIQTACHNLGTTYLSIQIYSLLNELKLKAIKFADKSTLRLIYQDGQEESIKTKNLALA